MHDRCTAVWELHTDPTIPGHIVINACLLEVLLSSSLGEACVSPELSVPVCSGQDKDLAPMTSAPSISGLSRATHSDMPEGETFVTETFMRLFPESFQHVMPVLNHKVRWDPGS